MVEGHCAKRYADDARQKCVGKRVVEIIWRGDPQNQANVERCARGRRLVAVECISKQVFLRFADDAAAPTPQTAATPAAPTRKRSSSVVDLTADSDDELICRPKKRARGDEGVVDLTLDSDDEAEMRGGRCQQLTKGAAGDVKALLLMLGLGVLLFFGQRHVNRTPRPRPSGADRQADDAELRARVRGHQASAAPQGPGAGHTPDRPRRRTGSASS